MLYRRACGGVSTACSTKDKAQLSSREGASRHASRELTMYFLLPLNSSTNVRLGGTRRWNWWKANVISSTSWKLCVTSAGQGNSWSRRSMRNRLLRMTSTVANAQHEIVTALFTSLHVRLYLRNIKISLQLFRSINVWQHIFVLKASIQFTVWSAYVENNTFRHGLTQTLSIKHELLY